MNKTVTEIFKAVKKSRKPSDKNIRKIKDKKCSK
jgi:hypothetical protein